MRCVDHPRSATNTTDIDPSITFSPASSRPHPTATKPGSSRGCGRLIVATLFVQAASQRGRRTPGTGSGADGSAETRQPVPSSVGCPKSDASDQAPRSFACLEGLPRMLESGRRIWGQQSRLETNFVDGLDAGLGKPVADVGRVEIGPNPTGASGVRISQVMAPPLWRWVEQAPATADLCRGDCGARGAPGPCPLGPRLGHAS